MADLRCPMYLNKIIFLLFFVVMVISRLIFAEHSEKGAAINREEEDSGTRFSREDMEIIKELELLENLDMFQGEDIDFLRDYDAAGENTDNEGNIDE